MQVAAHYGLPSGDGDITFFQPAPRWEKPPITSVTVLSDFPCLTVLAQIGVRFGPGMKHFRFGAIAPLHADCDSPAGFLLIADTAMRTGMSAAQSYVLQTRAVQIAEMLCAGPAGERPRRDDRMPFLKSMAERLRLLESVVVNANDAILITEAEPIDHPGPRIVYCNPAFTKTTGFSESEVIGKTPRILQSQKTERPALDRIRQALSNWQPIEIELLNVKRDGSEFWVDLSIVPVCDETGWYTHWVSVQRDTTERRRAEEIQVEARIASAEKRLLEAKLEEQRAIQAQLTYTATHDDLTKLRNRAFFMDRLSIALKHAQANRPQSAAVLYMDLDRFKLVNDSLGHTAGDLLLMMVARRLESCLRPEDTLARIGGDEFVILVENIESVDSSTDLAKRLCTALRSPFHIGDQDVFSMCSIGIVEVSGNYSSAEEIVRDADIAMYEAKILKAGGYVLFADAMHTKATDALQLETELQYAIPRNHFFVEYQCIHDVTTKAVVGMEALLRWTHPVRGPIPPSQFIPIAEDIGAIREIGRWVLTESCQQMSQWVRKYPGIDLHISVNISAVQLLSRHITQEIAALLQHCGLEPRHLQLEITESVFLHDPERVGTVVRDLRDYGIRIALDDFGTGYSSLGYIDKYPIDAIKIDRSFVTRLQSQPRSLAIVNSIVLLGQELGLDIIAEGVETEEQLQILKKADCRYIQGYLLAKPESVEAIDLLLQRRSLA